MKNFNSDTLNHFVRFGNFSDRKEREKIAEMFTKWEEVPLDKTLISKHCQENINKIISDRTINDLLNTQPHLKEEILQKAIAFLEKTEKEVAKKVDLSPQEDLIEAIEQFDFQKQKFDFQNSLISKKIGDEFSKCFKAIENEPQVKRNELLKNLKNEILKEWSGKISNNKFRVRDRKNNPEDAKNEDDLFDRLKNSSVENFIKDWKSNTYHQYLKSIYSRKDFDLNAFTKKIKTLEDQKIEKDVQKIEDFRKDFIDRLKQELSIEKLNQEIKIIDELRKKFLEELYKEIEQLKEFLKLLSPFIDDTSSYGRLWDLSKGNWQRINFQLIKEYTELLKNKKELQELADALGRYRKAEVEIKQEEYTDYQITHKFKINHYGKSELIGVTESDNLNHLLPNEVALFSEEATENIFYKKFSEKKLQTYQFIDKQNFKTSKSFQNNREIEVEKDKGPFILAVDTSGSMHGEPEYLAKVIAFAITKIALKDKRKALLISFSTNYEVFELTNFQNSLPKLIEFLQMSFNGGTDVSGAVAEAVKKMTTENYEKADLLIITDGVFGSIGRDLENKVAALKQKSNKFNTLIIGQSQNSSALQFCDNVWFHNSYAGGIKDLVRQINESLFRINL